MVHFCILSYATVVLYYAKQQAQAKDYCEHYNFRYGQAVEKKIFTKALQNDMSSRGGVACIAR